MNVPLAGIATHTAEAVLRRWIGLDVEAVGAASLQRAVRLCMESAGVADEAGYAALLETDSDERDRLVERAIVAESWFFRDPTLFDALRHFVARRSATAEKLRVLSAPCAAGEEPFSVAMTLFEAGWTESSFVIDAIDVSRDALARATSGVYSPNAFRTADVRFRTRWFREENGFWRIAEQIRRSVNFSWGNILEEAFPAGREPYDVILCRNLLIYLTDEARERVAGTLDRLLATDGIVILGVAEPPILRGDWGPFSAHSTCTLRRHNRGRPPARASAAKRADRLGGSPPTRPPGTNVTPQVVPTVHPTASAGESLLAEAGRLANLGRHADALALCRRNEFIVDPSPNLLFLMAMLHQALNDHTSAERCLHRTLYLDPHHEDALLALAVVASRRGDAELAGHYRQSAARAHCRQENG